MKKIVSLFSDHTVGTDNFKLGGGGIGYGGVNFKRLWADEGVAPLGVDEYNCAPHYGGLALAWFGGRGWSGWEWENM